MTLCSEFVWSRKLINKVVEGKEIYMKFSKHWLSQNIDCDFEMKKLKKIQFSFIIVSIPLKTGEK